MSTTTTNIGLTQPVMGDIVSSTIPALGVNMQTIDTEFGLGGVTANRPTTGLYIGRRYFDTTCGMPIYWNGTSWEDNNGRTPSAPMANAPTTGTWKVGDIVRNSAPVAGGNKEWICVTAGSPGIWYACGLISQT